MSVSVFWQPVKGKLLESNPKSSFCEAMDRAGLRLPTELSQGHRNLLLGIMAGDPHLEAACQELIDALDEHEFVRVWGEW